MKVSGYIRFAVNETGEETYVVDYKANRIDLQEHIEGFICEGEDARNLINMDEVLEKNPDVKNCLLLATFSFNSHTTFNGEHEEYNENVTVVDVVILSTNYKEIWKNNLLAKYTVSMDCSEEILSWEQFYDEDFKHLEEYDLFK